MARRRPTDWIDWTLYRRTWLGAGAALMLVLVTSFTPDAPTMPPQPAGFTAADAQAVIQRAADFDERFPSRRPGTSGAADSAQWIRDELRVIRDQYQARTVTADVVTGTTTMPGRSDAVSIMNVEARLPGRTPELVVIHAPRDTSGQNSSGSDSGSTAALITLAEQLASSPDRKRSYLLVSTDASAVNGAGARLLADRLERDRTRIVAVIGLDGIGQSADVRVPLAASSGQLPPLGLVLAARHAAGKRIDGLPGVTSQLLRLSFPLTRYEHGQLLGRGYPAITMSSAAERPARAPDEISVVNGMQSIVALLASLDATDTLQSAGKTYIMSPNRVARGWALKILIVMMLLPVWAAVARALVNHRRRLGILAALGSVSRGMIVGVVGVALLWLFAAIGAVPRSGDVPPASSLVGAWPSLGMVAWCCLLVPAWVVGRGPDWRRRDEPGAPRATALTGLAVLTALTVVSLSINPYTAICALPLLHGWLWLVSRHAFDVRRRLACVSAGLIGPVLGLIVIGSNLHVPLQRMPVYTLDLIATRSIPAALGLLLGMAAGCGAVVIIAQLDRIGHPLIAQLQHVRAAQERARFRQKLRDLPPPTPRRASSTHTITDAPSIRQDMKTR